MENEPDFENNNNQLFELLSLDFDLQKFLKRISFNEILFAFPKNDITKEQSLTKSDLLQHILIRSLKNPKHFVTLNGIYGIIEEYPLTNQKKLIKEQEHEKEKVNRNEKQNQEKQSLISSQVKKTTNCNENQKGKLNNNSLKLEKKRTKLPPQPKSNVIKNRVNTSIAQDQEKEQEKIREQEKEQQREKENEQTHNNQKMVSNKKEEKIQKRKMRLYLMGFDRNYFQTVQNNHLNINLENFLRLFDDQKKWNNSQNDQRKRQYIICHLEETRIEFSNELFVKILILDQTFIFLESGNIHYNQQEFLNKKEIEEGKIKRNRNNINRNLNQEIPENESNTIRKEKEKSSNFKKENNPNNSKKKCHINIKPYVKEINDFLTYFKNNDIDYDQIPTYLQHFIQSLCKKILSKFESNLETRKPAILDYLEELIHSKVYDKIIYLMKLNWKFDQDRVFRLTIKKLGWIKLHHLTVNTQNIDLSKIEKAKKELQKITYVKTPRKKIKYLFNCCQIINSSIPKQKKDEIGIDRFLPILIYILLHSKIPNIKSNLEYINKFKKTGELQSNKRQYSILHLKSAVSFLESVTPDQLFINLRIWEENMKKKKNGTESNKKCKMKNKKKNEEAKKIKNKKANKFKENKNQKKIIQEIENVNNYTNINHNYNNNNNKEDNLDASGITKENNKEFDNMSLKCNTINELSGNKELTKNNLPINKSKIVNLNIPNVEKLKFSELQLKPLNENFTDFDINTLPLGKVNDFVNEYKKLFFNYNLLQTFIQNQEK
ncbi:rab gdp/gtp exchange factor [Anaeramoeba flamelloides]|uniref:Rab gdp/gtp exchange factor n=1 Tax=Anaeramoeba flamelloides TaxID=1746091 RepID=A0AAV8A5K1_9EUKA|nr:rab gdp/gtp exchange factor [Anaeramoeba flamelloides]